MLFLFCFEEEEGINYFVSSQSEQPLVGKKKNNK